LRRRHLAAARGHAEWQDQRFEPGGIEVLPEMPLGASPLVPVPVPLFGVVEPDAPDAAGSACERPAPCELVDEPVPVAPSMPADVVPEADELPLLLELPMSVELQAARLRAIRVPMARLWMVFMVYFPQLPEPEVLVLPLVPELEVPEAPLPEVPVVPEFEVPVELLPLMLPSAALLDVAPADEPPFMSLLDVPVELQAARLMAIRPAIITLW
jgi:hypothetical protein